MDEELSPRPFGELLLAKWTLPVAANELEEDDWVAHSEYAVLVLRGARAADRAVPKGAHTHTHTHTP